MLGKANQQLEQPPTDNKDRNLGKKAKYFKRCKQVLWRRWRPEYLKAHRERHDLIHSSKRGHRREGDVVFIKSEEEKRVKWKTGIVQQLITGGDKVIRAV